MTTTTTTEARVELVPPTTVPCPDWCTDPRHHGYDQHYSTTDHRPFRDHTALFGDPGDVAAMLTAGGTYANGTEHVDDMCISVWIFGHGHDFALTDPDQARNLARLLEKAALTWEQSR